MHDLNNSEQTRLTLLCWLVLRALRAPSSMTIAIFVYTDIMSNIQYKSKYMKNIKVRCSESQLKPYLRMPLWQCVELPILLRIGVKGIMRYHIQCI